MRKTIITYGLICGTALALFLVLTMILWDAGIINFDNGEYIGYTGMVAAFSLVFFGIKSYRDNQLGGAIKFAKALQVGLLIALIAACMYAVTWEVYAQISPEGMNEFIDSYTDYTIELERRAGASQAELDQKLAEMKEFHEMYANPLVRFGMTLVEAMPVGILVTLISAAILRRKESRPAQTVTAA